MTETAQCKRNGKTLSSSFGKTKAGNVPEHDMFNTFNMGVGMSVIVAAEDAEKAVQVLKDAGEEPYIIGKIVRSDDKVTIW